MPVGIYADCFGINLGQLGYEINYNSESRGCQLFPNTRVYFRGLFLFNRWENAFIWFIRTLFIKC